MRPLYTSVTMKKMTPSLSETTVTFVDNVFQRRKQSFSVKQTETSCAQYNVWGKYFLMKHQKSVTSVYNALYREKLCNHCIQV